MVCARCGHVINESKAVCPVCGSEVRSAGQAPGSTNSGGTQWAGTRPVSGGSYGAAAAPQLAADAPPSAGLALLGWVALAGVLLLSFVAQYHLTKGNIVYSLGATAGILLLPGIIVALYYRRKTAPTGRKVLVLAAATAIMFLISLNAQVRGGKSKVDLQKGDIAQLAQEGVGKRTVQDPGDEGKQVVRELFGRMKQVNEKYAAAANALQTPEEGLLSAESFRDRATMERMLTYVKALRALDQDQENAVVKVTDDVRARVNAANWPMLEKQAFLRGFDRGVGKSMELRRAVMGAEIAWLDSVEGVYALTLQNPKHFKVKGGNVIIDSDPLLATYNDKVEKSEKLRVEFLGKAKEFQKHQQEQLSTVGLSPEDVGAPGADKAK